MSKQSNGNTQLNQIRDEHNHRTMEKKYMGNTWRIKFNNYRRFRTI